MTIPFKTRRRMETQIARQIVKDALYEDMSVSVFDGESFTIRRSRDLKEVMAALFTTDDDTLWLHPAEGKAEGWVHLVYGNDGWDVIHDYSVNLETLLEGANSVADELENHYG
jgi:hypothetical protein